MRLLASPPRRPAGIRRRGCRAASGAWPSTCSGWSSPSSCWPRAPTITLRGSLCWTKSLSTSAAPSAKALADQGFKNQVVAHGADLGIDVEIVERNPQDAGFVPLSKRWRVEQTYGILILHRRLVRDYEHRPSSSASRVYWAMSHVMARRLTGANPPTWREAVTV